MKLMDFSPDKARHRSLLDIWQGPTQHDGKRRGFMSRYLRDTTLDIAWCAEAVALHFNNRQERIKSAFSQG